MAAWLDSIPPELAPAFQQNVDVGGVTTPIRDTPFIKETPDLQTFVRKAYDAHREVGARIPVRVERVRDADGTFKPNADAVAAWKKDHLPKLYDAGILERPPATPQDYGIAKPEKLPEGVQWSDVRAGKLAEVAHKYGIPKAAVPELLDMHYEALATAGQLYKTDPEVAEVALRKEFKDYDTRIEQAKRLTALIFKDPAELQLAEASGLADHPAFLTILMRLAPLAAADSSVGMEMSQVSGGVTREQVLSEVSDIVSNPQNPRHKLYHMNDPTVIAYVDALYAKIPGAEAPVQLG